MTTVVPCAKNRTALASTVRVASRTPRSKAGGVLSTLCVTRRATSAALVERSYPTRSVNVPPTSVAIRMRFDATGASCRCECLAALIRADSAPAWSAGL